MTWIVIGITVFLVALFSVELIIAAPPYTTNNSDHFDGKKFVNPNELEAHHYLDVLKWWFSGNDKGTWHKLRADDLPISHQPDQTVSDGSLHVTFINHASFLLQFDGLNILTDPIWSNRASPFQWIGPKRMRPPGIGFDSLPSVDVVLISHNHYDHLDEATVKRLQDRHDPIFVVPLGVAQYLHDLGIRRTVQLDWWNHHEFSQKLSLTAVPARHFSGRGLFDRNKTLWCGYILHTALGNIYFAGDTGYGDFFEDIGQQFGPLHTSFIPIGAYQPRWFMEHIHLSPRQALQVHHDVRSEYSFAMHFGTFPLADDGMFEAKNDLQNRLRNTPFLNGEFEVPIEGQTRIRHSQPVASKA